MGKGGNQGEGATERETPMPTFSWEEIQKHNLRTDKWLVIDRKVYNITKWSSRHPGGHRVIGHYAGEDATVRVCGLSTTFLCCRRESGALGPRAPNRPPALNGAWGAREGRKVCLLRSSSAPNPRPLGQLAQFAVGVGFWSPGGSAAVEIRTVENRAGSTTHALAPTGPLHPASSPGAWDFPKGTLGP